MTSRDESLLRSTKDGGGKAIVNGFARLQTYALRVCKRHCSLSTRADSRQNTEGSSHIHVQNDHDSTIFSLNRSRSRNPSDFDRTSNCAVLIV